MRTKRIICWLLILAILLPIFPVLSVKAAEEVIPQSSISYEWISDIEIEVYDNTAINGGGLSLLDFDAAVTEYDVDIASTVTTIDFWLTPSADMDENNAYYQFLYDGTPREDYLPNQLSTETLNISDAMCNVNDLPIGETHTLTLLVGPLSEEERNLNPATCSAYDFNITRVPGLNNIMLNNEDGTEIVLSPEFHVNQNKYTAVAEGKVISISAEFPNDVEVYVGNSETPYGGGFLNEKINLSDYSVSDTLVAEIPILLVYEDITRETKAEQYITLTIQWTNDAEIDSLTGQVKTTTEINSNNDSIWLADAELVIKGISTDTEGVSMFEFDPTVAEYNVEIADTANARSFYLTPTAEAVNSEIYYQFWFDEAPRTAEKYLPVKFTSADETSVGKATFAMTDLPMGETHKLTLLVGPLAEGDTNLNPDNCNVYNFTLSRMVGLSGLLVQDEDGAEIPLTPAFHVQRDAFTAETTGDTIRIKTSYLATSKVYLGSNETAEGDGAATYAWSTITLADYTPSGSNVAEIPLRVVYEKDGAKAERTITLSVTVQSLSDLLTPVITQQPIDVKCNKGESQELSVEIALADDDGTVTYQWYSSIYAIDDPLYVSLIDGETKSTYLPPSNVAGTKYYYCEVTNTVDGVAYSVKSDFAQYTVNLNYVNPPVIAMQPGTYTIENKTEIVTGGFKTEYNAGEKCDAIFIGLEKPEKGTDYSFSWYYNTIDSNEGGTPVEAKFSGGREEKYYHYGYVLNKSFEEGTYYIYCVVTAADTSNAENYACVTSNTVKIVFNSVALEGFSGSGTQSSPYLIQSVDDLIRIRDYVASGQMCTGLYFEMTNDITLPENWEPIGTAPESQTTAPHYGYKFFGGILDGADHTLTIPTGGKPLFNFVSGAEIRNLNIKGERIEGYGLIDNYFVDYGEDNDYLTGCPDCVLIEKVKLLSGSSTLYSGFMPGSGSGSNTITIRDCEIGENVVIGYDQSQSGIGSFVGGSFNGTIENCTSSATVYGKNMVGGFVGGKGQSMGLCDIKNSQFLGEVVATGDWVGGLIGKGYTSESAPNTMAVTLANNLVAAKITGKNYVGGIFGGEGGLIEAINTNEQRDNIFYGQIAATASNPVVGGFAAYYGGISKAHTFQNNYFYDANGTATALVGSIGEFTSVDKDATWGFTTDELNAFKAAMGSAKTVTDFAAGGDVLGLLNAGSYGNWTQGDLYPVHGNGTYVTELTISDNYKTEYLIGEDLSWDGVTFTAKWSDNTTTEITSADITVDGYDKNAVGEQTVVVSYKSSKVEIKVTVTRPDGEITVTFSLLGDTKHGSGGDVHTLVDNNLTTWIAPTEYTISTNDTVKDLLEDALSTSNMTCSNPTGNYVESITYGNLTLAQKENGPNSGWMFTVNSVHGLLGVSEQYLEDGDVVVFHYTDDYTLESRNTAEDQEKADAVEALISAIGEVTLDSEEKITAAREAYDALTDSQKKLVENLETLEAAEKALADLKATEADKAAVANVENLINAIGDNITLDSENAIVAARTAYDALTADLKLLVTNYNKLVTAEKQLEILKMPAAEKVYQETGDYLAALGTPGVGSQNGEWRVIGLERSGRDVSTAYYDNVVKYVTEKINSDERLDQYSATENARVILALTAMGYDVTSVAGHNLLAGLDEMSFVESQGINGPIWTLIALDSHKYDPVGDVTRVKLYKAILEAQLSDGGWALSGTTSDPDMTAMAIQALAPYYNTNSDIKTAVDNALAYLSKVQNADGGYSTEGTATGESAAQVIVALTALGIDPDTDSRFVKNGISVLDALCAYAVDGGGFAHVAGSQRNTMATEQGYYALAAYFRMKAGQKSLYDMTDVTISATRYTITEGADSTWNTDAADVTIKTNGVFAEFLSVKVDGKEIDQSNYTAAGEPASVTLKKSYLSTLALGKHTVTLVFTGCEATTGLTITESDAKVVKAVEDLINAIGTVTKDSKEKIEAARNAYDALTDAQKKLVSNYDKLVAAEKAYAELADKITVYFSLLGDSAHGDNGSVHTLAGGGLSTWIESKAYTVKAPATVFDVFKAAVSGKYSYTNEGNYISSINGLSEFTNGRYSGWMYTLNGSYPILGIEEQYVSDGDVIVFHYTDDYTVERHGFSSDKVSVQEVIKLIKEIGTVTLDREDAIKAAREAYDKLSDAEKAQVHNYDTLTAAEEKLSQLQIQNTINLINQIGTVTLNSGDKIDAAWNAYNALTTEQKLKVTNRGKLDDAQKKYNTLRAEEVEKLIDDIDEEITLESEEAIVAARKAYDKLTKTQQGLVDDEHLDKLKAAELALAELKATEEDKKKAQEVIDLIDKLGDISLDSEEDIEAARKAYEKLTDIQKALVTNYDDLVAAEETLEDLKNYAVFEDVYITTGDYIEGLGTPEVGSIGGEWMVIGLARSGREVPDAYYDNAVAYVLENIDENERLHNAKSTENSRLILALTAIGKDVTDVKGHNLLLGLNDMDYLQNQGINGPIWALIALDSGNYPVPEGNVTREDLIQVILDAQLGDGGWALSGNDADPDMTGMALQALAPYYSSNENVKMAVDSAITTLSMMQNSDGSYSSIDGASSESIAQVVVALTALGINPDKDERFIKNDISALDALIEYYVTGGGFKHILSGNRDGMATEQAYYALTAYYRFLMGSTSLYDMTDVIDMGGDPVVEETLPVETEPVEIEDEGGFPWWIIIVIGMTAVVVIVVYKKRLIFWKR